MSQNLSPSIFHKFKPCFTGAPSTQEVVPASTQCNKSNNPFLDPTNQAACQIPTVAVPAQSAMTNGAVHSVASSNPPHVNIISKLSPCHHQRQYYLDASNQMEKIDTRDVRHVIRLLGQVSFFKYINSLFFWARAALTCLVINLSFLYTLPVGQWNPILADYVCTFAGCPTMDNT